MSTIRTLRLADRSWESKTTGITALLAPFKGGLEGNRIVLLPDVHYPFHPSTGLVTDKDIVEAVVNRLLTLDDIEVTLGLVSGPLGASRTARILGYADLTDTYDIDPVVLGDTPGVERTVTIGTGSVDLTVPKPLENAVVVNLPTLRTTAAHGLRAGLMNLAGAVAGSDPSPAEIWAAYHAMESITLLDAAVTNTGEPRWTGYLAASDDVAAVDTATIDELELADDVPYVNGRILREWRQDRHVEGPSFEQLGSAVGTIDLREKSDPGGAMATGYRLYSRITGDAVPPMFVRGNHA